MLKFKKRERNIDTHLNITVGKDGQRIWIIREFGIYQWFQNKGGRECQRWISHPLYLLKMGLCSTVYWQTPKSLFDADDIEKHDLTTCMYL